MKQSSILNSSKVIIYVCVKMDALPHFQTSHLLVCTSSVSSVCSTVLEVKYETGVCLLNLTAAHSLNGFVFCCFFHLFFSGVLKKSGDISSVGKSPDRQFLNMQVQHNSVMRKCIQQHSVTASHYCP